MPTKIDPELQQLIEAHPLLFRGLPPRSPSLVMPGWYVLVNYLCTKIESTLGPERCATFEFLQIKEKFGTLSIYFRLGERTDRHVQGSGETSPTETHVRKLVAAACTASAHICAKCRKPGELRNLDGYAQVLCEQHLADLMDQHTRRSS